MSHSCELIMVFVFRRFGLGGANSRSGDLAVPAGDETNSQFRGGIRWHIEEVDKRTEWDAGGPFAGLVFTLPLALRARRAGVKPCRNPIALWGPPAPYPTETDAKWDRFGLQRSRVISCRPRSA